MSPLIEKIQHLSLVEQREVSRFIETLKKRTQHQRSGGIKLRGRGVLRDSKSIYTSVELQHDISKLRMR